MTQKYNNLLNNNYFIYLQIILICLLTVLLIQDIQLKLQYIYILIQPCNYNIVQSFVLLKFLLTHMSETEEQETKYFKWWYGKMTLLTRGKLIHLH